MILLRGTAATRVLVVLTVACAVACSSDKKTLLLVNVRLAADVSPPTTVSLTVTPIAPDGSLLSPLGSTAFSWPQANVLQAGIFLPDGVSGNVRVDADGTAPSGKTAGSADVQIVAGQTNGAFDVMLLTVVSTPDAEAPEAGLPATGADALGSDLANSDVARVAPDGGGAEASLATPDGGAGDSPVDGNVIDAPIDGPAIGADAAPGTTDTATDASQVPTWQAASNVENDVLARSFRPAIAIEPLKENVLVAWYEDAAVKVKRWDRQSGTWGSTKTIENRGTPDGVAVGTDASGHMVVAWYQDYTVSDPGLPGVWVSHSSDGVAWTPPQQVAAGTIIDMQLGVARSGVARLAFSRQTASNQVGLFTAYFDKTSWTVDANPVLAPDSPYTVGGSSPNPQLAIGGTGDGIVVFDEYDDNKNYSVGVANLVGSTRTAPQVLDTNTTVDILDRSAAMNANSEGVVVWAEDASATSMTMYLSSYKPSVGWISPQRIVDSNEFYNFGSALDDKGFVTAAWVQSITTGGHNVMAIHGKAGGTWSDIIPLETDNVAAGIHGQFAYPSLAADVAGDVLAVWAKKVDTGNTYGAYGATLQGGVWQPAVKLGQKTNLRAWNPAVAVADSGFGAASFVFVDPAGTTTDTEAYNVEVAFFR
ncbi:MAG TPA: hypothetical protein VJ801_00580 [Polyangia bacterium]|jgi:hypothetical protein|nr:hypothetical protein [Polyangia bacterium]